MGRVFVFVLALASHFNAVTLQMKYKSHNLTHDELAAMHRRRRRRLTDSIEDSGPIGVYGDANLGYYYVDLFLGKPSSSYTPQRETVIIDTGSGLTAVPCIGCKSCGKHMDPKYDPEKSPSAETLACGTECRAVSHSRCSSGKCNYHVSYSEGSSLSGYVVRDTVFFAASGQETWHEGMWGGVEMAVGCHRSETNLFVSQKADGIMGLSASSYVINNLHSQGFISKKSLSMCLAPHGGYMTLGQQLSTAKPNWIKMQGTGRGYVSVKMTRAMLGSKELANTKELAVGYSVVLDSGTTFTYLHYTLKKRFYKMLTSLCKKINCPSHKTMHDEEMCFAFNNKEEVLAKMPDVTFDVGNKDVPKLVVKSPQWLFRYSSTVWCVGIYDNGSTGTLIGANFLVNYETVYDFTDRQVAFIPADCTDTGPTKPSPVAPATATVAAATATTPNPTPTTPKPTAKIIPKPSNQPDTPAPQVKNEERPTVVTEAAVTQAAAVTEAPREEGEGRERDSSLDGVGATPTPQAECITAAMKMVCEDETCNTQLRSMGLPCGGGIDTSIFSRRLDESLSGHMDIASQFTLSKMCTGTCATTLPKVFADLAQCFTRTHTKTPEGLQEPMKFGSEVLGSHMCARNEEGGYCLLSMISMSSPAAADESKCEVQNKLGTCESTLNEIKKRVGNSEIDNEDVKKMAALSCGSAASSTFGTVVVVLLIFCILGGLCYFCRANRKKSQVQFTQIQTDDPFEREQASAQGLDNGLELGRYTDKVGDDFDRVSIASSASLSDDHDLSEDSD